MSDAWNAPGWSAQQPATYYNDDSPASQWVLPVDVETVKVVAKFADLDGGVAFGYVSFQTNERLVHEPTKTMLEQANYYVRINRDGSIAINLPATDAEVLSNTDRPFAYHVEIVLGRKLYRKFTCYLPKALGPEVNLFDLTPVPDPQPFDVIDIDGGTA